MKSKKLSNKNKWFFSIKFRLQFLSFIPTMRCASVGISCGPVSLCVCHKLIFYQTATWIELVFGIRASLELSHALRRLGYPPK